MSTMTNRAGTLYLKEEKSRSLDLTDARERTTNGHQRSASDILETNSSIPKRTLSISSITSAFSNLLSHKHDRLVPSSPVLDIEAAKAMHPLNEQENKFSVHLQDQMTESKRSLPDCLQQEITQFAIDGYAKKYFATHKKGMFIRRTVPLNELLCWTKDMIRQPLILSNKNTNFKDALRCFRTLQILMTDRPKPRQFDDIEQFQFILNCGISKGSMRDEIYVQLCKQLNQNPKDTSIKLGWEILSVISITFPPSKNLEEYLFRFVQEHHEIKENQLDIYSQYVTLKLNRICSRGARGKVLTCAEIERAKEAPFKPSVFGESLDTIMNLQKDSDLKIPRIIPFLTHAVHELNGKTTEGIFRIPGDADAVTELRIRIENGQYDSTGIDDPNVPASLLKYWLRDLADPLIPTLLYPQCIQYADNKEKIINILDSLPELNKRIILYMIRFLQDFTHQEVIQHTLMNVFNLAMVFAPNFLRCPSTNLTTIFENSKHEQNFVKTLLTDLQLEQDISVYSEKHNLNPIL